MPGRLAIALVSVMVAAASLAGPASAQDGAAKMTVAGGYSFLRDLGAGATPSADFPKGWFASLARSIGGGRFGITGEVSSHARTNLAIETVRLAAYLGGLEVGVVRAGRLRVLGRALAGVERFSEPGFTSTAFALQPGASVDIPISGRLAARVGADYRLARKNGILFKEVRAVAGAVWGIGAR